MQDHVEELLKKLQDRQKWMKTYLAKRDVQLGLSMEIDQLENGIKRVSYSKIMSNNAKHCYFEKFVSVENAIQMLNIWRYCLLGVQK